MNTKLFLFIITVICVFAWIGAVILDKLDDSVTGSMDSGGGSHLHPRHDKPPHPDGSSRLLHWFIQISDIHISKFWDPHRVPDLQRFCKENIDVIRPEVVMASGDLTDAKHEDRMGSEQYPEEWIEYDRVLKETRVTERTVWLDVKGNHDAFDVPSLKSHKNYFRVYSAQGHTHPSSYRYVHKTKDGQEFSFIAVDATPLPGAKRPFNFFGMLSDENMNHLVQYAHESRASNMTVWFGHYPSSVLSDPRPFRRLLSKSIVYVSGHLHTLGGLMPRLYSQSTENFLELELGDWMDNRLRYGGAVYLSGHLHTLNGGMPHMYSRHPKSGNLELELGDWKDNRIYRVIASDHDLFSFTDVTLGEWPVVLVTNPKDAQFIVPTTEPTGRIKHSTHVRILAFSPVTITNVKVTINGIFLGSARQVDPEGPLFVLPWQPKEYIKGFHHIEVHVTDAEGRERIVSHSFTLDDSRLSFDFWRRIVLLLEHADILKALFWLPYILLIASLISMKVYAHSGKSVSCPVLGNCVYKCIHRWLRRLYLLTQTPGIFWPLILFHIYVLIGPWFIGYLSNDNIGFMFVFGLYFSGQFMPAAVTWAFGFIQLVMFNIPLTLYLARTIDIALGHSLNVTRRHVAVVMAMHVMNHLMFYIMLILQAWFAYGGFYKSYGLLSLVVGPVRSWSIILAVILQQVALRAKVEHYKVKYETVVSNGELSAR